MLTKQNRFAKALRTAALSLWGLAAVAAIAPVAAQAASRKVVQKTFASPEEAAKAAAEAVASHDRKTLASIFGPGSERLFSSGDAVADRQLGERFTELYSESHKVVPEGEGKAILQIGKNDWPLPVPIVKQGETWRFDTAAAQDEIIDRRIGRNELFTIQTILAIADAQQDYAAKDRNGDGLLAYAQKFRSSPGKRDGLYWPAKPGATPSPLGPYVAKGGPYAGYRFRQLPAKDAAGALPVFVGWPAKWDDTGVKTFVVDRDGVVRQKDLGPESAARVRAMSTYAPDASWQKVD